MNKKIKLFFVLGLSLSAMGVLSTNIKAVSAENEKTYYVDFFNNYLREEFTLSNGTTGK